MKDAIHTILIMGSLWPIWSCQEHIRLNKDEPESMRREVDEPFKKVLEGGRDERRKDDHRPC